MSLFYLQTLRIYSSVDEPSLVIGIGLLIPHYGGQVVLVKIKKWRIPTHLPSQTENSSAQNDSSLILKCSTICLFYELYVLTHDS